MAENQEHEWENIEDGDDPYKLIIDLEEDVEEPPTLVADVKDVEVRRLPPKQLSATEGSAEKEEAPCKEVNNPSSRKSPFSMSYMMKQVEELEKILLYQKISQALDYERKRTRSLPFPLPLPRDNVKRAKTQDKENEKPRAEEVSSPPPAKKLRESSAVGQLQPQATTVRQTAPPATPTIILVTTPPPTINLVTTPLDSANIKKIFKCPNQAPVSTAPSASTQSKVPPSPSAAAPKLSTSMASAAICKEKSKKRYGCPTCEKLFRRNSGLNEHIKSVHKGIKRLRKPVVCEECGKTLSRKESLKNHMINVHAGKGGQSQKENVKISERPASPLAQASQDRARSKRTLGLGN